MFIEILPYLFLLSVSLLFLSLDGVSHILDWLQTHYRVER